MVMGFCVVDFGCLRLVGFVFCALLRVVDVVLCFWCGFAVGWGWLVVGCLFSVWWLLWCRFVFLVSGLVGLPRVLWVVW